MIRCRPPANDLVGMWYEEEALARCRHFLEETVAELEPKALLAVGGTALKALTGYGDILKLVGYAHKTPYGRVIGVYHPSYLIRGNIHLASVVRTYALRAVQIARNPLPDWKPSYTIYPSPKDAMAFKEAFIKAGHPPLAFDIETPYTKKAEKDEDVWDALIEDDDSYNILRISFAFEEGKAISMPWMEPFSSIAREIISEAKLLTAWNANFDVPRLIAAGADFTGGEIVDSMHAWKCLEPSLPMGLKFVAPNFCPEISPWHMEKFERPEFYSAADSDILLRVFSKLRSRLESQGRWEMFYRHFVRLSKVLMKMTKRGVKVNQKKREEARDHFQKRFDELSAAIQKLVPLEVLKKKIFKQPLETLEKKGLKREDLLLVEGEGEIKKGWELSKEGFLVRSPKPPKKSRKKKNVAAVPSEPS